MSTTRNPVGWFEIPVEDMARAKSFYEALFKVELEEAWMEDHELAMFPMDQSAPGSAGCLTQGQGYAPSGDGVVIYFTAPDLDAAIQRADDSGGSVLVDRTSIGEHGFIAIVGDTEGNRIGLHSCN